MKVKKFFVAVIATATIMCTGCDMSSGGSYESTPIKVTEATTEVTAADKKAYVQEKYSKYFQNDLRAMLPFSDIMGIPLADLKATVNASSEWDMETSLSAIHIDGVEIAYSFSNRNLHFQDSDSESLGEFVLGGVLNFASVKWDPADYVDVVTDDTSKQRVQKVYILKKNSNLDFETVKKALEEKFILDDSSTNELITICGLVAEPDYQAIYDYEHGLTTTEPANIGLGYMSFNMSKNGNVIFCFVQNHY